MKNQTIGVILTFFFSLACAAQHGTDADSLFVKLRNPRTSQQAATRLLQMGTTDQKVQHRLGELLPQSLEDRSNLTVWQNKVMLAGQLKILTTIPVLARLLTQLTEVGILSDFYREAELLDDPVGKALARIGDPAVPSLRADLNSADVNIRWRTTRVLLLIGSPLARQTLRERLLVEKDPTMRLRIEYGLKHPPPPEPQAPVS